MFRIQNIRYISLLILLVLTALSYHPIFSNIVTLENGENPIMKYVIFTAVLVFILHFDYRGWFRNHVVRTFIIFSIIIGVLGYLLTQMDVTKAYGKAGRDILMAFVFLAIGYNSRLKERQLLFLIIIYSISVAYVTYNQLMQHAGGFVIRGSYLDYGKNTLGVMCAMSCISLLFLFYLVSNKYLKLLMLALYVFILVLCISIRARADFLVIFLMTIFVAYRILKRRRLTMQSFSWLVFGGLFVLGVMLIFPQIFINMYDYVMDSFTRNHDDDITAGREYGWHLGIRVIEESPIFGNLSLQRKYETLSIHNYFLRQLSSFGIIGSFPILFLYFYLLILAIKKAIKAPVTIGSIGFITLPITMIISLEEPTFPFGPGTGVILSFLLLGYSLSQYDNSVQKVISNNYS